MEARPKEGVATMRDYTLISKEIAFTGRGYILLHCCGMAERKDAVRRAGAALRAQGAREIFLVVPEEGELLPEERGHWKRQAPVPEPAAPSFLWYTVDTVWLDRERPIPREEDPDLSGVPAPQECGEALIDVTERHPRIAFDRAYQKRGLHGAMDRCLMREEVWRRLCTVADGLPECWSLLIYDCLRPLPLQKAIYEEFAGIVRARTPGISPEEVEQVLNDFVARPVKRLHAPAPHTTGGAVDLTLCKDGVPVDMGTGFDDLTPAAHTHWLEEHPEHGEALRNRRLLFHRMTEAGFINYCTEWWHFAYGERMWAHAHDTAPRYGFCAVCDFPES